MGFISVKNSAHNLICRHNEYRNFLNFLLGLPHSYTYIELLLKLLGNKD